MCNLGEEPPPLPVLEFEVTGAVPLDDFHGGQLLLTFTESPEKNTQSKISSFCALGPKKAVKKYKESFV